MADRHAIHQVHMQNALDWSRLSTCQHLNVGAVIAVQEHAISSGYNGAPPGLPHCMHDDSNGYQRCTNTNHAEGNALAFAARHPVSTQGATLYTTHSPCKPCAGLIISAGITAVYYGTMYETDGLGSAGLQWLHEAGVYTTYFPWRTNEGEHDE